MHFPQITGPARQPLGTPGLVCGEGSDIQPGSLNAQHQASSPKQGRTARGREQQLQT